MPKLPSLALAALLFTSGGGPSPGASCPVPSYGTLVIALPSNAGLIIAADRRTYDSIHGDLDNSVKILDIDRFTAVAAVGNPTFFDSARPDNILYDAKQVSEQFLRNRDIDGNISSQMIPLANELSSKFRDTIDRYPFARRPATSASTILYKLIVFHYNVGTSNFQIIQIAMHYYDLTPEPKLAWNVDSFDDFSSTVPYLFGNLSVWKELRTGSDPRFGQFRNNDLIKDVGLTGSTPVALSETRGIDFCRTLIKVTAENVRLVDSSPDHVGPTADIAIISPDRGFSWIYRDQ